MPQTNIATNVNTKGAVYTDLGKGFLKINKREQLALCLGSNSLWSNSIE